MNRDQKAELQGEILEMLDSSPAIYLTDFAGLTVEEVNIIRKEFKKFNIRYKVVKNTLVNRALSDSQKYSSHKDSIAPALKGPTGIVFSGDDPVEPAKILKKHFDKIEKPKLKLAVIENEVYGSKQLNQIASLQSKAELIAGILGSLNAPVSGIVGSINAVMRDLGSVIEEVAKKKAA